MRTTVICPRCGSESIYYHDVAITVDYDYLAWEEGKLVWTQDTYDRDYIDLPPDIDGFRDGEIGCETCQARWPDLEALEREALARGRDEAALVAAETEQFGETGNYVGLEMY